MPREVTGTDDETDGEDSEKSTGEDGTKAYVADREESERRRVFSLVDPDSSEEDEEK